MTDSSDWAQPFRQVHIFAKLTEAETQRLLAQVERRTYREGEVLFAEGDPRARLLLIRRGRIELTRVDVYGARRPVVTLVRGDLLGEGMMIEGSVHSTTATALTETEVAFLHRDKVRAFFDGNHDLEKRMLASLRQRQSEVESDEVVELGALLATAVASKAEARPCPVFARPAEALPVRASRDHLQSVVQHLLQNAIEATDADGQVEVRVERHASEVRATITDTGCGMDRDFIHNRLFRPFDTTKGKAGMGIGAYESRHLISSMRGELLVESEPGRGTTFTIVLPLAENQEHPEARIATGH